MNSLDLFTERVPELENLPENPITFWYPNAGNDFRGPVFFTDKHIEYLQSNKNKEFTKPELFVFNSLNIGNEVENLKTILREDRNVVFKHGENCEFKFNNFKVLTINDQVIVNENSYNFARHCRNGNSRQVFYFEQEITGLHLQYERYSDVQRILYFEWDSIDFFENLILQNFFEITYLCCINEGYGSERGIFSHIYIETNQNYYSDQGFKPKFLITEQCGNHLRSSTGNSEIISGEMYYNVYPKSSPDDDYIETSLILYHSSGDIYKIEYGDGAHQQIN